MGTPTPKRKGDIKSPKKCNAKKHNEKGEICNWDSGWEEAMMLKLLVQNGKLNGLGAAAIKKNYPQFASFNTNTLNGALQTIRNAYNKAVNDRKKGAGEGSKLFSLYLFVLFLLCYCLSYLLSV
jgi:hypothetical protein